MNQKEVAENFNKKASVYNDFYEEKSDYLLAHEKKVRYQLLDDWIGKIYTNQEFKILDVGCGSGNALCMLASKFPKINGIGIDISKMMVEQSKRNCKKYNLEKRLSFHLADDKFYKDRYNIIYALGVIGYQEDQILFAKNLASAVQNEGVLIFTFGNKQSFFRKIRTALYKIKFIIKGQKSILYKDISLSTLDSIMFEHDLKRIETKYISFGFGIFRSKLLLSIAQRVEDKFSHSSIGKYFGLTGQVLYRKE